MWCTMHKLSKQFIVHVHRPTQNTHIITKCKPVKPRKDNRKVHTFNSQID